MDRDAYVDGEIPYNEPGWKEVTKNNGNHTVSSSEASLAEKNWTLQRKKSRFMREKRKAYILPREKKKSDIKN